MHAWAEALNTTRCALRCVERLSRGRCGLLTVGCSSTPLTFAEVAIPKRVEPFIPKSPNRKGNNTLVAKTEKRAKRIFGGRGSPADSNPAT